MLQTVFRFGVSFAVGIFVAMLCLANFQETGIVFAIVFGGSGAIIAFERLTVQAQDKFFRDNWRRFE